MEIKQFLRMPGRLCPEEALERDVVLDKFISDLDAQLLGSKNVRLLTLAEFKDHLLEKKTALAAQGMAEAEAAISAVASMGAAGDCAAEERRELWHKFQGLALLTGIPYGLLMGAILPLREKLAVTETILAGLAIAGFGGIWFGSLVEWFFTFVWPERRISIASASAGDRLSRTERQDRFCVGHPKPMKVCLLVTAVLLVLGSIWYLDMAVAAYRQQGIERKLPDRREDFVAWSRQWALGPWWFPASLGVILLLDAPLMVLGCGALHVDEEGFAVAGILRRKRRVRWSEIRAVGSVRELHTWIPRWMRRPWGKRKYVEWSAADGRRYRFGTNLQMVNADRFVLLLESKVAEHQSRSV